MNQLKNNEIYNNLIESIKIVETLRGQNGCKWDKE